MNTFDPSRHNLLVNVARMHYLQHMTHQQIADKLSMTRVKVTRLVAEAVEKKIIEFKIADPLVDTLSLQDTLRDAFGLKDAIVAPSPDSADSLLNTLGAHAAAYLSRMLKSSLTIGLGWGRTLNAMIPHLSKSSSADITVVSLTGGLAANKGQPNPYDVVSMIAGKLGCDARYLLAPAIVTTARMFDMLKTESNYQEIVTCWKQLGLCMVSIGHPAPDTGIFYSFADPRAEVEAIKKQGAVGDLLARPFDINGTFLTTPYSDRTVSIDFSDLKKSSLVVGVAGGAQKTASILGALRSGYLNVLITDENSARAVLALRATQE